MSHVSWHTDCPEGQGIDALSGNTCHVCLESYYDSPRNDRCLPCPWGYTNGMKGATDDSGCTSMYTYLIY